jgi:hypothetical protein
MWSKGLEGGAARWISARPAAGVAGKVAREGLGVVGIQHRGLHTAERRPVVGCGGAAAGNFAPTSLQLSVANKRVWELCRCTREAGAARVCGERRPEVEFTVSTEGREWRLGGAVFPRAKDGEALL